MGYILTLPVTLITDLCDGGDGDDDDDDAVPLETLSCEVPPATDCALLSLASHWLLASTNHACPR